MIKPKIKKDNGIWICRSEYNVGYGSTPYEAWQTFIRHCVGY